MTICLVRRKEAMKKKYDENEEMKMTMCLSSSSNEKHEK